MNSYNLSPLIPINPELENSIIRKILEKEEYISFEEREIYEEFIRNYKILEAYFFLKEQQGFVKKDEKEWIKEEGYKLVEVDEQAIYEILLNHIYKNGENYISYQDIREGLDLIGKPPLINKKEFFYQRDLAVKSYQLKNYINKNYAEVQRILYQWYGKENIFEVVDGLALVKSYLEVCLYDSPDLLTDVLSLDPFSSFHVHKHTKKGMVKYPKKLKTVYQNNEKIEYKALIYAPKSNSKERRLYVVYKEIKDYEGRLKNREVLEFIWASHGGNEEISRIYDGTKVVIHEKSTNKTNGYKEVANVSFTG